MITELEFKSLAAQGYNRIPLIAEAFADLETPLSLYLKLATARQAAQPHSFLLESVVGGERFGRYSFIGLPARTLLRATGFRTEVVTDGEVVETDDGNPLDFIAAYQQRFKVALRPGLPRFCGGLAGYFGYDAVRYIEPRLAETREAPAASTRPTSCCCRPKSSRSSTTSRAAVPDRLCRPGAARGVRQRASAGSASWPTSCSYERHRAGGASAAPAHAGRARVRARPTTWPRCCAPRSTSPPAT